KERLLKHEYCAHIINAKKVVCKCGKTVKLNQHYTKDYLNRHIANSGYSDKDEDWNSDIYDNMDEDDLLQVDELEEE
ncbi:11950_t:CDS:2, partial [Funneliformis geosporum]